jgi:hypothetical protein
MVLLCRRRAGPTAAEAGLKGCDHRGRPESNYKNNNGKATTRLLSTNGKHQGIPHQRTFVDGASICTRCVMFRVCKLPNEIMFEANNDVSPAVMARA